MNNNQMIHSIIKWLDKKLGTTDCKLYIDGDWRAPFRIGIHNQELFILYSNHTDHIQCADPDLLNLAEKVVAKILADFKIHRLYKRNNLQRLYAAFSDYHTCYIRYGQDAILVRILGKPQYNVRFYLTDDGLDDDADHLDVYHGWAEPTQSHIHVPDMSDHSIRILALHMYRRVKLISEKLQSNRKNPRYECT